MEQWLSGVVQKGRNTFAATQRIPVIDYLVIAPAATCFEQNRAACRTFPRNIRTRFWTRLEPASQNGPEAAFFDENLIFRLSNKNRLKHKNTRSFRELSEQINFFFPPETFLFFMVSLILSNTSYNTFSKIRLAIY